MVLRKQAFQQFGAPGELSWILMEKIRNGEVKKALVVGLPYSGKHEFANSLKEKIEKISSVVLFDADENPGDMYQNVVMALESFGIKFDIETIKNHITTPDSRASTYKHALKIALNNFSKDCRKLVLIMRDAEKAGGELENEIFNYPPEKVAWVFVSSYHRKVLLPNAGRFAYADVGLSDSNTFYLKPFQGMSIESFCKLKKIVERQALENLKDFLSGISTFTCEGSQPSNFLEALRMKIVEKGSIPNWVEEALGKYGCFEIFDNAIGRELLASRNSHGDEPTERTEESATEWLKRQTSLGRFKIQYDKGTDKFFISDTKISKYQQPHYKLNAKSKEGRRINVVATLLRAYSNSIMNNLDDAWCRPPVGADWREMLHDNILGGYDHFNSVELETESENGKNTARRRVKPTPNLDGWTMHGPA